MTSLRHAAEQSRQPDDDCAGTGSGLFEVTIHWGPSGTGVDALRMPR